MNNVGLSGDKGPLTLDQIAEWMNDDQQRITPLLNAGIDSVCEEGDVKTRLFMYAMAKTQASLVSKMFTLFDKALVRLQKKYDQTEVEMPLFLQVQVAKMLLDGINRMSAKMTTGADTINSLERIFNQDPDDPTTVSHIPKGKRDRMRRILHAITEYVKDNTLDARADAGNCSPLPDLPPSPQGDDSSPTMTSPKSNTLGSLPSLSISESLTRHPVPQLSRLSDDVEGVEWGIRG